MATNKDINKIYKKTVANMKSLGTYKDEFITVIQRYAEMRYQLELLTSEWEEAGFKVTEEYTNKAGATNIRKTALYLSIESLRKELLEIENILGLTPKGLKQLKAKGLSEKSESPLLKALREIGGDSVE